MEFSQWMDYLIEKSNLNYVDPKEKDKDRVITRKATQADFDNF
jgi:hypothetical protein